MKLISLKFKLFLTLSYTITTITSPVHGRELLEFNMTTVEIIEKYGYPAETHTTESEDGYILKLHRIPFGKNSTKIGTPILAAHGLLADSSLFVLYGKDSLGFFLADEGYDVWLINIRGNHYSRAHKYLSSEDGEFWDFSWHEYGFYDLPAYIDYVLEYTKSDNLLYLGFSMGTSAFFVMASEKPEYGRKIRGAVLLAPVASVKHNKSLISLLVPFRNFLRSLSEENILNEILRQTPTYRLLIQKACNTTVIQRQLCKRLLFLFVGIDPNGTDEQALMNFVGHASDASSKTLIHYLQLTRSGGFRQYDYGPRRNFIKYGQLSPPDYNIWSIATPTYLFVGSTDVLANTEDVLETLASLPSVKGIHLVPDKLFNHVDFFIEKNVKEKVYYDVARRLKELTSNEVYGENRTSYYE